MDGHMASIWMGFMDETEESWSPYGRPYGIHMDVHMPSIWTSICHPYGRPYGIHMDVHMPSIWMAICLQLWELISIGKKWLALGGARARAWVSGKCDPTHYAIIAYTKYSVYS